MPRAAATTRGRGWCFTYWPGSRGDLTEDDVIAVLKAMPTRQYLVVQKETGKQGNQAEEGDHLQGWIYFKNAATFAQVKARLIGTPHIEFQEGSNTEAAEYCKKEETRREPFEEIGDMPQDNGGGGSSKLLEAIKYAEANGIGKTMDQDEYKVHYARTYNGMQKLANRAAAKRIPMMRPMMIYYIWGDSDAGKSHWASSRFAPDDTFVVSDTKNTWFDNYQGESCVILDEFGGHTDFELLKRLLDGSKMNIPTKGSHVYGEYSTVIITSNYHPNTLYDQGKNFFSNPPQAPGPLQRRISTGGLFEVRGQWHSNPKWTPEEPVCGDLIFQAQHGPPEVVQQQQQQQQAPEQELVEELLRPFLREDIDLTFDDELRAHGDGPGDEPGDLFGFGPGSWQDNQAWLDTEAEDLSEFI